MFVLSNVKKTFRDGKMRTEALRGISYTFPSRGLVFLVGKSGSGKSTLLNLLGGYDRPTSGKIIFCGKLMSKFSGRKLAKYRAQNVTYLFQENNLFPSLRVKENILFAGGTKEECEAVAQRLGIGDVLNRKVNQLSGGQLQRVAIARAILQGAQVLLADEPTGNLDEKTGQEIFSILKELSSEKLVIVVTHDRESAERFGDVILSIKDGQLEQITGETPPEEQSAPTDPQRRTKRYRYAAKVGIAAIFGKWGQGFVSVALSLCLLLCVAVSFLCDGTVTRELFGEFITQNRDDYPYVILYSYEDGTTGMGKGRGDDTPMPTGPVDLSREVFAEAQNAPAGALRFDSFWAMTSGMDELSIFGFQEVSDCGELTSNSFYYNIGRLRHDTWDQFFEIMEYNEDLEANEAVHYYDSVIIDGEEVPFQDSGLSIEDCHGMSFKLYYTFLSSMTYETPEEVPVMTLEGIIRDDWNPRNILGGTYIPTSMTFVFSDTFEECESRSVIIPVEENFPAFLEEIGYVWYDYEIFDVGFSEDGSEWINLSINREIRDAANALNTLAENMQLTAFILCILYILLALFIATVSILSKRREIALMRALGMTKFKVLGAYFGGILLLIIPVTVVALLLVFACVPFINNVVFGTVIGGHMLTLVELQWEAFAYPAALAGCALVLLFIIVGILLLGQRLSVAIRRDK